MRRSAIILALIYVLLNQNDTAAQPIGDEFGEYELEFRDSGSLGMQLDKQLRVIGFPRIGKGERPGPVELSGVVRVKDYLVAINDEIVSGLSLSDVGQVLRDAAESLPRVLRFSAADGQRRQLSAMGKRAAGQTAQQTLTLFTGLNSANVSFPVLSANFSRAFDCLPYRLVLAEPFHGCQDIHDPTLYADAIVLVSRGECSFFHKAHSMIAGGAAVVVVVNSDSVLFEMEAGENEGKGHDARNMDSNGALGAPVVMLGLSDAQEVFKLLKQASSKSGELRASVYSEGGCAAPRTQKEKTLSCMSDEQRQKYEDEAREALAFQSPAGVVCFEPSCKGAVELIASVATGSAMVEEWSGHVSGNLTADTCTCASTFDFISAHFSGPLTLAPGAFQHVLEFNISGKESSGILTIPVHTVHWDELCEAPLIQNKPRAFYTLIIEARHPKHRLKQFQRALCDVHTVALHAQQSGSVGVLFASPGHVMWHLESLERPDNGWWESSQRGLFYIDTVTDSLPHGPSSVRIPVAMVSKTAADQIAKRGSPILMIDHKRNLGRWKELRELAHITRWPIGKSNREKLVRRLRKDLGNDEHYSRQCKQRFIEDLHKRMIPG